MERFNVFNHTNAMFKSVLNAVDDLASKKRRRRSTSPDLLSNTKKRKENNDDQTFFINSKPDNDNVLMENCYKVPIYRSIFLEHRVKEKRSDTAEGRYFSKKYRATVVQDMSIQNVEVSNSNHEQGIANENLRNPVEMKTKKFNEDLLKEPTNIDMWIDYVNFQEEKLKNDMKSKEIKSAVDKRMLNEIKMAVIDEGLKKNPRNLSLSLLRLEIGEMLWERERVEKCWKDLISKGRLEVKFWRKYVDFMRRKFDGFTVGKMLETYRECFRYLRAQVEEDLKVLMELTEFLWELLEFLDGAGHSETCIAIFQLMFELNLNIPENVQKLPFPDKLDFLSAYWSGFQPKFGEEGWVGWKEWVEMMGRSLKFVGPWSSKDADEEAEFKLIAKHHSNRPECWFSVESYRSSNHWCSWRPDREDDEEGECCEDEERIVIFDDISGFLFHTGDENFKFQIVWRFLDYLVKRSKNFCFGNMSTTLIQHGSYTSFKEVCCDHNIFSTIAENLEHVDEMADNVFEVAMTKFKDHHKRLFLHRYVEHVIHSEGRQKELRKIFKNILRENNDDICLWMKYAKFEKISGKVEVANKVIETSIMNIRNINLTSKKVSYELLVRRSKVDLEVGFGCSILCEGCLLCKQNSKKTISKELPDVNKVLNLFHWLLDSKLEGPSGVLQVKKILEKKLETALSDFQNLHQPIIAQVELSIHFFKHDILHLTHLLTLFTFLTSSLANSLVIYSYTMNKILAMLESNFQLQKEGKFLHRVLSRNRWNLLKFCEDFTFVPRSTSTSLVVEDVINHPNDALIVENYYHVNVNPCLQVGNEIMKLVYSENDLHCLKLHHIKSLIRKIMHFSETGFQVESITSQLKSFFEICFNTRMKTCTLTWILYLYFHNLVKNEEKSSTRKFFRAIEGMPGSKVLYMQAILYNPDMLTKIIRTMDAKEIRLRTFVEEINLLTSSYKILHTSPNLLSSGNIQEDICKYSIQN